MGHSYQIDDATMTLLRQYQYSHWGEYAGDYVTGDALVEAVTGHVEEHRRAYESILNAPGHLQVIKLKYAQWQLRDLANRIYKERNELQQLGVTLWSLADDGIYQVVQLGLSDTSPRTRGILRDRYDTAMLCIFRGGPLIPQSSN
jgi:hypothetical protein